MIFRFLFKIFGWKIVGNVPSKDVQCIYAVAPHNSWVDFIIGVGLRSSMRLKIGYLGKAELFRPPYGFIFRALGGVPVHRTEKRDMVASQVASIKSEPSISFALAPEGTRKNVGKLRSGFYYIAHGAGIPIVMIGFDLPNRRAIMAEPFQPTGDFQKDMKAYFVPFFEKIEGFKKTWISNYKNDIF